MPDTQPADESAPDGSSHSKRANKNSRNRHNRQNSQNGQNGQNSPNGYMGLRRARKYGLAINGWIILDKPVGLRSTAAVAKVQSLLRARKCGHAGTLDPVAEGLLPLALGMATKTVSYAMDGTKNYDIVVRWGERSNTDDSEGEIEETSSSRPSREQIEGVLEKFTGEIEQRPPSFSALRIEGKRAYDLARKGEKVILEPRPVLIASLKLVEVIDKDLARFAVDTGKGAYMRALARDLGEVLGCLGRLESLRRRRVGAFYEKHAISLDALEKIVHSEDEKAQSREEVIARLGEHLLPIESVLAEMPRLVLERDEQRRFRQGQGLLFVSSHQRERITHIKEEQPIATFAADRSSDDVSYSLPKLLGIGSLVKGRFKAQRLFVEAGRGAGGGAVARKKTRYKKPSSWIRPKNLDRVTKSPDEVKPDEVKNV